MTTSRPPTELSQAPRQMSASLELERFAEELPYALVTALERRYLTDFNPAQWELSGPVGDGAQPLLQQVLAVGRSRETGQWARAMPHALSACHESGHALLSVVHGTGSEHRLYLGGRRLVGAAARSTHDYLQTQSSAFKAFFTGLELGAPQVLRGSELPELTQLLAAGQSVGVITGIPSGRGGRFPSDMQSVDRLVRAVGPRRFALVVVAEPLDHTMIDDSLDRCRRLRGEIHGFLKRTMTRSEGQTDTVGHLDHQGEENWSDKLPAYLFGMSVFLQVLGVPFVPLRSAGQAVQSAALFSNIRQAKATSGTSKQVSESRTSSESTSVELFDANAEACDRLLEQHINRLQAARASGWWQSAVYIVGDDDAALHSVASAFRSTCGGDATELDPLRLIEVQPRLIRPAIQRGQVWNLRTADRQLEHPLGPSFSAFGTCVNSDELAVAVNLPQQEISGVPLRERSEFALCAPVDTTDAVRLGRVRGAAGCDLAPVTITSTTLNRHVLVTGITGSGKTNTCMRLLIESYEKLGVPFLVIEPAKAEYNALGNVDSLRSQLQVYSIGVNATLPLRLNPLEPVPGISLARHVDLLKAVFNASFPMHAGMTYVLEEAIHETYAEYGWNLFDSSNPHLGPQALREDVSVLTPSLQDLHDKIEVVLNRKQYSQEIQQNLGAALRSRLRSLLVGHKGLVLNTHRSVPFDNLFARPAVIELQELGDDEEKAFVMALLFVLLYEYAEVRQHNLRSVPGKPLQHVTLIEEAHRLLQAVPAGQSPDIGNPRAKAVGMFTDMLAEMRSLGEGFVVADQIPTKLTPEIIKNSNLKIVHRLVAPDDRSVMGSCLNLSESQSRDLNNLTAGLAVMHDERIGEALLVHVDLEKGGRVPTPIAGAPLPAPSTGLDRRYLHRHAGCRECSAPCAFFHRVTVLSANAHFGSFFAALLFGDAGQAWQHWLDAVAHLDRELSDDLDVPGMRYCAATTAAQQWLLRFATSRRSMDAMASRRNAHARLDCKRGLLEIAPVLRAWSDTSELNEGAVSAFQSAARCLNDALLGSPPEELPGCARCPSRCTMLPFVASHLPQVSQNLESAMMSQQPAARRVALAIASVNVIVGQLPKQLRNSSQVSVEKACAYCAATSMTLTTAGVSQQMSLLDDLVEIG